jgi:hypothetical protein
MADKLPKYRKGIGTGRTIAPKSGVSAGVTCYPTTIYAQFDEYNDSEGSEICSEDQISPELP